MKEGEFEVIEIEGVELKGDLCFVWGEGEEWDRVLNFMGFVGELVWGK